MISSTNNIKVKEWMKLKQSKYRKQSGLFLVEGDHLVQEALKQGLVKTLICLEGTDFPGDIERIEVSQAVLEKLSYVKTPQPVMAICYQKDNKLDKTANRYLLLDDLQDPGNIGTLIRTALAFDYTHIILNNNSVDLYNDKLIRASQGAIFMVNIIQMNLMEAIKELQNSGVQVIGTSLHDAVPIDEIKAKERIAIVLGNEGNGMHPELLQCCDDRLYIPIRQAESLNVAIAGAICMYHFSK